MKKRGLIYLFIFILSFNLSVANPILINDGSPYPGGDGICSNNDPDDPDCWSFILKNLNTKSHTNVANTLQSGFLYSGPVIGLRNDFSKISLRQEPLEMGSCLNLPNNYVQLCHDSLTVSDSDLEAVIVERYNDFDVTVPDPDLFNLDQGTSAAHIFFNIADGLKIDIDAPNFYKEGSVSSDIRTKEIWFVPRTSNAIDVFYYDSATSAIKKAGYTQSFDPVYFISIENDFVSGLSGTSLWFGVDNDIGVSGHVYLILKENIQYTPFEQTNFFKTKWKTAHGFRNYNIVSLGDTSSMSESSEVVYNDKYLGVKNENHRSRFGIVINNPQSQSKKDSVVFKIPNDLVQSNVLVRNKDHSSNIREKVPIGVNIGAQNQLGNPLNYRDISSFLKTIIDFDGSQYSVSEEIYFGLKNNISPQSSITSVDDDYHSSVFLEFERSSLNYIYSFDDAIDLKKVSASNPLKIKFLGKDIEITNINSDSSAYIDFNPIFQSDCTDSDISLSESLRYQTRGSCEDYNSIYYDTCSLSGNLQEYSCQPYYDTKRCGHTSVDCTYLMNSIGFPGSYYCTNGKCLKSSITTTTLLQIKQQTSEASCLSALDCNDNLASTRDVCDLTTKKCANIQITECISFDGFCPSNCNFLSDSDCPLVGSNSDGNSDSQTQTDFSLVNDLSDQSSFQKEQQPSCFSGDDYCPPGCNNDNDLDCKECFSSNECNDNNACTLDTCSGIPKSCIHTKISEGCNLEGRCVPTGTRTSSQYCNSGGLFKDKISEGGSCSFDYECENSSCKEGKCKAGFFKKLISALLSLFRF